MLLFLLFFPNQSPPPTLPERNGLKISAPKPMPIPIPTNRPVMPVHMAGLIIALGPGG